MLMDDIFPKNKFSFVLAVSSKQAAGSQEWFVGIMCAGALLTLLVLIGCFVLKNKGGKYAGKTQTALEVTQRFQDPVQVHSSLYSQHLGAFLWLCRTNP